VYKAFGFWLVPFALIYSVDIVFFIFCPIKLMTMMMMMLMKIIKFVVCLKFVKIRDSLIFLKFVKFELSNYTGML